MNHVENQMLWVEKYRPQTVSDCILPTSVKKAAEGFVKAQEVPNLILTGTAGTGKTTLAKALCNDVGMDWKMVNGPEEGRLLETLRVEVRRFASSKSMMGKRKAIIIDESDYMPLETVQPALRSFMEEYAENCTFIMTCNFLNRMMDAMQSRSTVLHYNIPSNEKKSMMSQTLQRVFSILDNEEVEYDKKVIATLLTQHYPDLRRLLNELQRYTSAVRASGGNKIDTGALASAPFAEIDGLMKMLAKKEFMNVRTWVAQNTSTELDVLCRRMYDNAPSFMQNESLPDLVCMIADYQYKNSFVADKEINMMAFLTEVMASCEFK